MKLLEIVYDLKSIIHNGHIPDDSRFSNRLIANWIDNQRALWLVNEYNKNRELRNNEVQILTEVEFELVDANQSNSIVSNNVILKSKKQIPRVLQTNQRDMITKVQSLDHLEIPINYVSREKAIYSGNGIVNNRMLFCYRFNDYLYIKYGVNAFKNFIPTNLHVEGVFEKPLDIDDFNETYGNIWDGIDQYPISRKFIEYIKAEIIKADVLPLIQGEKDTSNDDEN